MTTPMLSVIVPDCETPEQTKITLRLLRKYSLPRSLRIYVAGTENKSFPAVLSSMLKWVDFIDFSTIPPQDPAAVRTRWEDFLSTVETPFVMFMDSGVACLRADWSDYLLGHFDSNECSACKGCGLSFRRPGGRNLISRSGSFIRSLFSGNGLSDGETCSFLICRRELFSSCFDLSQIRPAFTEEIFRENVLSLPRRETDKFFCRFDNLFAENRENSSLPAVLRDILDAGELDL